MARRATPATCQPQAPHSSEPRHIAAAHTHRRAASEQRPNTHILFERTRRPSLRHSRARRLACITAHPQLKCLLDMGGWVGVLEFGEDGKWKAKAVGTRACRLQKAGAEPGSWEGGRTPGRRDWRHHEDRDGAAADPRARGRSGSNCGQYVPKTKNRAAGPSDRQTEQCAACQGLLPGNSALERPTALR
jgi:hypothetical protein